MHIPPMPSITDLPSWESRDPEVAFKTLEENLGEMAEVGGEDNCGYYTVFEAFSFIGKE